MAEWGVKMHTFRPPAPLPRTPSFGPSRRWRRQTRFPPGAPVVVPLPVPLIWDARLASARLWQLYRRLIQVPTLPEGFRWRSEAMPAVVKELAKDCRIEIGIRRPVGTVANDTDDVWLGGKVAGGSPARITCGSVETGVHKVVMRRRRSAMQAHTRETDRGRE